MATHRDGLAPHRAPDAVTALAVAGLVGFAVYAVAETSGRNRVVRHPPDNAPARAARLRDRRSRAAQGRTVTIARPRAEVWAFLRDPANLPLFVQGVVSAEAAGDRILLSVRTPRGATKDVEISIENERDGEAVLWRTAGDSPVDIEGHLKLRDGPAGRGTEITGLVRWSPPGGRAGHAAAKAAGRDPRAQVRRQLKRLKMLLETGEIATSQNRRET